MSEAGEFVDAALQREGDGYRADAEKARLGSDLGFYGASVGAVRGTIRDAGRRHPELSHDEVTALSSELWGVPVFERRLAAIVLLQTNVRMLTNSDLTRIEGFVRAARLRELVDPLAIDVIGPLVGGLPATTRAKADVALDRWASEADVWLRRAALLSPLRSLKGGGSGTGTGTDADWDGFARRARAANAAPHPHDADAAVVGEAIQRVLDETGRELR